MLDMRRFRANVVIESEVPVNAWQGLRLAFGEEEDGAVVQMADAIARCVLITVDPNTGAPLSPRIGTKVLIALGIAVVLWIAFYALIALKIVDL